MCTSSKYSLLLSFNPVPSCREECGSALIHMGGNSSSRLDPFEASDGEGVTVVTGIRLTDRVIDRMKESPQAVNQRPQSKRQGHPPVAKPAVPLGQPWIPGERLGPILPHPPSYASSLVPPPLQEPVPPPVPLASVTQETPTPGDSSTPTVEAIPPLSHTEPAALEHVTTPPPTEPVSVAPSPPTESLTATASPVEAVDTSPSNPSELSEPVITAPPPFAEVVIPPVTAEPIAISVEPTTTEPLAASTSAEQGEMLTTTSSSAEPASVAIPTVADTEASPSSDSPLTVPVSLVEEPVTVEPSEIQLDALAGHDEPTEMPRSPPGEPVPSPSPLSIPVPPSASLEELVPPQSSSALAVPSELPSLGQMGPPPTEETPAPPSSAYIAESAVAPGLPPLAETSSPLTCPPKSQAAVNEEELRKQIRDELQKQQQEEMKMAELKIQQQLKDEKVKAEAEAQAKARLQIQAEVQKVLEREQIALQQSLKDAVMKERMNTEDERLVAQYYIQKLEEKKRDLAKQDSLYKEQITKLEEKTAQFTRVTAESFKKGLDDTHNRFKRYQIKPVCSELQSEILKCYKENTGQTLTCSNIASLYMQCVDNAKQNKKLKVAGVELRLTFKH
ncbi:coiled-coil-helix-coiled-coil-helix domain containing 3b isoform X2 [Colossoma macropomum]|uniref:coiled-coil-helix-coiled-coil-helix domain containing 3b isoform X2 n=1 Tax=Colossoma macropomum TaxID=42526 RepID=UPI0018642F59|nr:coiled-coil-helix-coiled-coil-helix domain containing 3b isoform X2 [Colossoma macropomum]